MKILLFTIEYSLNNKTWTQIGSVLDGKYLSTKFSGGYVGAYLGLYAFAKTPAIASFDWQPIKKPTK